LTGANNSAQYLAVVEYTSLVTGQRDTIKLEIGFREPLMLPEVAGGAKTILLSSRREVAIRDFYDPDYAIRHKLFQPGDEQLIDLVRQKIRIPGNQPVDTSEPRLTQLRQQVEAQLRPVLRESDFQSFDLDRTFGIVSEIAARVDLGII
jgi:hypothetical protein